MDHICTIQYVLEVLATKVYQHFSVLVTIVAIFIMLSVSFARFYKVLRYFLEFSCWKIYVYIQVTSLNPTLRERTIPLLYNLLSFDIKRVFKRSTCSHNISVLLFMYRSVCVDTDGRLTGWHVAVMYRSPVSGG